MGYDAEFEVDLRCLAGEDDGTPLYWQAAQTQVAAAGARLRRLVAAGEVDHLSVLALARIPVLLALGAAIGEGIPVQLYPTRRSGAEGFGWTPGVPAASFGTDVVRAGEDPLKVAVAVSISGTVDVDAVAAELDQGYTIYGLGLREGREGPEVICSQESLDAFTRAWRDLLAGIESGHPAVESVAVFAAVPAIAAVVMGRALMRGGHPALRVFDLSHKTRRYEYALQVRR